jgi:hypothetical protein
MSVKLDSRYRLPLGVIIGVIVFLAVGFGLNNGTLGAFLAGLVAAIVGASKTKTYGRGAYFFTAIISVIITVVLLSSGLIVAKSSIQLQYPLIIVVIGNAFLVLVLCAVGGIIGNAFGRRFLKI